MDRDDDVSSSILTQTDFAYAPSSNTVTYVAGSYVASSPTVAGTYNIGSIVNNEFLADVAARLLEEKAHTAPS